MRCRLRRSAWFILVIFLFFSIVSSAPYIGAPSLTLLAPDYPQDSSNIEIVGDIDEVSTDYYWTLIFLISGNPIPSHEAVISQLLEKHDADLLLNAEVTSEQIIIPYLFVRVRTHVKGQPARIIAGGVK